jgi:hypothetical protein
MFPTDSRWQAVAMQREFRLFDTVELPALFRRCVGAEIPTRNELGYDFAVGKLSGAGVQAGDDSDSDSNKRNDAGQWAHKPYRLL